MIITLFGASRPDPETEQLAYEIGKRIGKKGFVLKNGGNTGTMEASAKGCSEQGGKAIGALVKGTNIDELNYDNKYLTEKLVFENYRDRVEELMKADRMIVLPGQIGTLEELFMAWVEAIVNDMPQIIVMGERNKKLINFLLENKFIKEDIQLPYIKFVESIDEIDFLR